MKKIVLCLLFPAMLCAADITILRDSPRHGNTPGTVIAVFAGAPDTLTVGGRQLVEGLAVSDPDSLGRRDTTLTRIWLNWPRLDLLTVADTMPARAVLMHERYLSGYFTEGRATDEQIRADSLWQIDSL